MSAYGCNVIYEICDENYDSYDYVLGKDTEGEFKDDENHERFPSSYGFEYLEDKIVIEIDRKGEYNT